MKKIVFLGLTIVMILALLATGCTDNDDNGGKEEELEPAPDFTLTSLDNDTFSLSDYLGKVVILDFMFVNCPGCIDEMEHLKDVYDNYDDNYVVIITIDIVETDTEDDLRDFRDTYGDDWTYAMDTDNVENKYGTSQYPTLIIVNKEGEIAHTHVGETSYSTLSSELDELL